MTSYKRNIKGSEGEGGREREREGDGERGREREREGEGGRVRRVGEELGCTDGSVD